MDDEQEPVRRVAPVDPKDSPEYFKALRDGFKQERTKEPVRQPGPSLKERIGDWGDIMDDDDIQIGQ